MDSNNVYYFETIKECEKEIVDKTIFLDIVYTTSDNNLNIFKQIVGNIMFILYIIIVYITLTSGGRFKDAISISGASICIYIAFLILMGWIKYNHSRLYTKEKFNLVDGLLDKCKEYKEAEWNDWERKQMLKRFADLGGLKLDWDKVK